MAWETVIGFEVHTQLKTRTKIFCGCSTRFDAPPNSQTCPVCLGMPGSLPVLNRRAVELALKTALALHCEVPAECAFDRKNYYYPDLPKNYQISQNYRNLGTNGHVEFATEDGTRFRVGIINVHLEEDAGKNIHPEHGDRNHTLVDLNRAGTPLLEIVSAPDIRTKDQALAFMQGMRQLIDYLGVSDGKMQEGSLRFELNISVRRPGAAEYGTKVEVKNLNSIQAVLKCIDHEFARQTAIIEAGGKVEPQTRLWDDDGSVTRAMRNKETANDYRYFPEPDLVTLAVTPEMRRAVLAETPELPLARKTRFMEAFGLSDYDATTLTGARETADYFETAVRAGAPPKQAANWILTEMLRALKEIPSEDATISDLKVPPLHLAEMVKMIEAGTITGKIAKQVFPKMLETGKSPAQIVEELGLKPIDDSAIGPVIDEVIAAHPGPADDVRQGKMKAMGFLMGEIMKRTKGKANPATVTPLLKKKLGVE
jgi:aspartyl-tRNA(Asn)/glutamyl-tRNA(Gln) amidotransferase subunit B